jgi:1-acyl-sn-glycerol-3-phosphate acyltransferase
MGVFIKKIIKKEFQKNENYVIVSNHLSMVDIPVTLTLAVRISVTAKKTGSRVGR